MDTSPPVSRISSALARIKRWKLGCSFHASVNVYSNMVRVWKRRSHDSERIHLQHYHQIHNWLTMKSTKTTYGIYPSGPYKIPDLHIAIHRKWRSTLLGHSVVIYRCTSSNKIPIDITKIVFDPKRATSVFDEEEFTEIPLNSALPEYTPSAVP